MGTRCGEVDPTLVLYLMEKENLDIKLMSHVLHKESGVLGVSGISSDLRDVEEAADKGNKRARLALDMLCYGIKKHIGAYAAAMGGIDAIAFTAGIGENSSTVRKHVLEGLEFLGVKLDEKKNDVRGEERIISTEDSTVSALIVPTNEELVIARDTKELTRS
jgi:acetate kinase